jgi:MFS family permease
VNGRAERLLAGFRAFRHRNYRLYFLGTIVSLSGVWLGQVAQSWLLGTLVGWEQAVVYIGLLSSVQFLPVLCLGLFGGVVTDIWPKRRILYVTQSMLLGLQLTLGVLTLTGLVAVWHVFLIALLVGFVLVVDAPTRQAFVVELVGGEDLVNAVALNSAVQNAARIFGPAVAGVMIGITGTGLCFVLNGLSFLALVACLATMNRAELIPAERLAVPRNVGDVGRNVAEGLRYIRHTPLVLLAMAVVGAVSIFGMSIYVVLPVMAVSVLHAGPEGLGMLFAAAGFGALLAALGVAVTSRPHVRVLVGGGLLVGAAELLLSGTDSFGLALPLVFCIGAGMIASTTTANSLIQLAVPGPLRGRVMAVYQILFSGSSPIGGALTGGVGGLFGIAAALVVNGVSVLVAGSAAAVAVLRGAGREPRRGAGGPGSSGTEPAPGAQALPADIALLPADYPLAD